LPKITRGPKEARREWSRVALEERGREGKRLAPTGTMRGADRGLIAVRRV